MILDQGGQLYSPPIWVDFQRTDWERRIRLDSPGTKRDLARWGIVLTEGRRVVIYQEDAIRKGNIDDLVAVGILHFDPDENDWAAVVDWSAVHHASELEDVDVSAYGSYRPLPA